MNKIVTISTSLGKKVVDFLESYEDENIAFKHLSTSGLNIVFDVYTEETDDEKLKKRIKDIIKSSTFGAALFFMVTVNK